MSNTAHFHPPLYIFIAIVLERSMERSWLFVFEFVTFVKHVNVCYCTIMSLTVLGNKCTLLLPTTSFIDYQSSVISIAASSTGLITYILPNIVLNKNNSSIVLFMYSFQILRSDFISPKNNASVALHLYTFPLFWHSFVQARCQHYQSHKK